MKLCYEVELVFVMTFLLSSLYASPTWKNRPLSQLHQKTTPLHYKENEDNDISNSIATSANHIPHRHFHSPWHLRNKIDKINLNQKIDRIRIQNLQNSVKNFEKLFHSKLFEKENEILEENTQNYLNSKVHEAKILEKDNFMHFQNSGKKSKITFSESSPQFDFDSIGNKLLEKIDLQIQKVVLEEMKNIRSKMTEMESCCRKCDAAMQANAKEKSIVKWMLQIVPNLQQNVKDLQESTDVVQSLHDKQDLDSRLRAVGRDVTALQKGRSTLATEVESVMVATDTLTGEMKEVTSRIQKVEGGLIQVKEQLEEQTAASDDLLKALPDGFLVPDPRHDDRRDRQDFQGYRDTQIPVTEGSIGNDQASGTDGHGTPNARIETLELRTASLDFALMNLQKKVFFESMENKRLNSTTASPIAIKGKEDDSNRDAELSKRFDEIEFELSKLKESTESVLKALSSIEKHNGDTFKEIDQKLSKVETQIDREREERQSKNSETRSNYLETEKEVRDDYVELKNDVTYLKKQFITLEDRTRHLDEAVLNNDNSSSSETSRYQVFDDDRLFKSKINEVCLQTVKTENGRYEERLLKLENLYENVNRTVKRNSKVLHKRTRHRHGRRWQS